MSAVSSRRAFAPAIAIPTGSIGLPQGRVGTIRGFVCKSTFNLLILVDNVYASWLAVQTTERIYIRKGPISNTEALSALERVLLGTEKTVTGDALSAVLGLLTMADRLEAGAVQ